MAPKDYVTRGRAPKDKKKPPKPPVPWLRIVITLLLVAGFGYFLWFISADHNQQPEPESEPQEVQQPGVEVPEENLAPLPDIPEEEWEFFTLLPSTEVKVDVAEEVESGKRYLMQCGSFRKKQQADRMRAQIALQGLEAIIRPTQGKKGMWYRVILGPYERIRRAEVDKHRLQKININGCAIWFWNL